MIRRGQLGARVGNIPPGLGKGAGFEDGLFERRRIGQSLPGIEDFDAGEAVRRVVIQGDAVLNELCDMVLSTNH